MREKSGFPTGKRKVREQGLPRWGSFDDRFWKETSKETRPNDTVVQASKAPFQDKPDKTRQRIKTSANFFSITLDLITCSKILNKY
jgi:hypothetical protein